MDFVLMDFIPVDFVPMDCVFMGFIPMDERGEDLGAILGLLTPPTPLLPCG